MSITRISNPVVTGTEKVGSTLAATDGEWSTTLSYLTYEYQWMRCNINGGACVDIPGATGKQYLLQAADLGARLKVRVKPTEHTSPPPPDPPPVGSLPFAEAAIRTGYQTITNVPASTQTLGGTGSPVAGGNDCLIDLQNIKRTVGSLLIYGRSGQRIKVINGFWEVTKPNNDGSPYWRGGPRARSSDGVGPEHISFTHMHVRGSTVPDCFAMAAGMNTKVTYQNFRHESRFAWDGQDSTEPAEHSDSFQVQGLIGAVEVGMGTAYCMNVANPNEGGKVFQLKNEGGNDGFTVAIKKVNMRGGGRTGTFLLQTTRDIPVTLEDVWLKDDGITTGSAWSWATSGGGMLYPNSSAGSIGWTRSGSPGSYVASWPASANIVGQIKEGLPPGGDFVTRAMLGV